MSAALLLLPLAGLAWTASVFRPGWAAGRLRPLLVPAGVATALCAGVVLALAGDPYVLPAVAAGLAGPSAPLLAALAGWLNGPALPGDLLAAAPLLAILALDAAAPGCLRPFRLSALGHHLWRRLLAAGRWALPLVPLAWAWSDVLAATGGERAQRWYDWAAGAGLPAPGPLQLEPDPRLPAVACWLVAGGICLRQSQATSPSRRWPWRAAPIVAAMLVWVIHGPAVALAVPAFAVAAGAALLAEAQRSRARGGSGWTAAARAAPRLALLTVLLLALSLRWTDKMTGSPASDTQGYFEAALRFHQRVTAEGTNGIALAYTNIHPAAREPLFPLLVRAAFDALGESLIHQRYLTVAASVGVVGLSYLFGRATLGTAAALGAATLVAVEPWHVLVSQEGLREEVAGCLVYGLAALVAARPRPGPGAAITGGLLAGGAMLTRLDSGGVVALLLAWWAWRSRHAWRRIALAWGACAVLVAPLLLGYQLRQGQALAPLGSGMGGDIRAAMEPLMQGDFPPGLVAEYLAAGTWEVYAHTILGSAAGLLPPALRLPAVLLALACLVAGILWLLRRGPRLPAVLAVLGTYVPPFAFIAGIGRIGGPGGGYTERYTYLILPAVFAVTCWAALRLSRAALRVAFGVWEPTRPVRRDS